MMVLGIESIVILIDFHFQSFQILLYHEGPAGWNGGGGGGGHLPVPPKLLLLTEVRYTYHKLPLNISNPATNYCQSAHRKSVCIMSIILQISIGLQS